MASNQLEPTARQTAYGNPLVAIILKQQEKHIVRKRPVRRQPNMIGWNKVHTRPIDRGV